MPDLDSIAVGLLALVVYLAFSPSVSGDKDASEFTLVLATRGVAHPTGYPLYTLLGSLFVQAVHGLGATWSFAANAWSAVGGAFAIAFFHALIARLLPPGTDPRARRWIPLTAIALLFLNPIWTVETTLAEVYSWHVAWACGLSCLFVNTLRRLERSGFSQRELSKRALGWGVLSGVGLAHHATSVLVIVPLSAGLVFALARAKRLRAAPLLLAFLASLVPLTAYFWVVWRAYHPAGFMWPTLEGTPTSILRHLTGQAYTNYLGWFAPSEIQQLFLKWYVYPFLFPAIALSAIAAGRARALDDRVARWSLLASAVIGTTYAFFYGVSDPSSYFLAPLLLSYAVSATLLGTTRVRVPATAAVLLVVLAAWLSVGWVRIDVERKRQFVGFNGMLHDMWNSIPFDTAFVFWRDDMYVRLHEYQLFRGEKPGLAIVHPSNLTQPAGRHRFIARYGFDPLEGVNLNVPAVGASGRQVAVDRLFDDIEHNVNRRSSLPVIHFDPAIPTVRLLKKGPAVPDTTKSPSENSHG
jgi:transmembrane protein TMEM260 (protein O-mannosyltransferase)